MRIRCHRSLTWSTSLPLLLAFFACSSLTSRASSESRLAAEVPEVAREVTFRIEGAVPASEMPQCNLSVGTKTALIAVLSAVVFGMLVLIRSFGLSQHIIQQGACVLGFAALACSGIAAICILMGHPRFRLDSLAGNVPLSNGVSSTNYMSVYIAVVEGDGSPSHNLHPGRHLLLQTSTPTEQHLAPGCRLSVAVDADTTIIADPTDSTESTVATH